MTFARAPLPVRTYLRLSRTQRQVLLKKARWAQVRAQLLSVGRGESVLLRVNFHPPLAAIRLACWCKLISAACFPSTALQSEKNSVGMSFATSWRLFALRQAPSEMTMPKARA